MITKVKLGNRPRVKRQIAEYLVLAYAPGATLKVKDVRTPKGKRTAKIQIGDAASTDPNVILWTPLSGLSSLLHEIGHHRMEGHGIAKTPMDELVNEAVAWRWAEWAARQENLWFDYSMADKCFATYAGKAPLKIDWRFKDVFK